MPYFLIPLITSIVLGAYHIVISDASRRSKITVGIVVAASLVVWRYYPQRLVVATLMQVAVGIYVLIYLRLKEDIRL